MLAVCGRFVSFLADLFLQTPTCNEDSIPIREDQIWGPDFGSNFGIQIWAHLAMLFWLLIYVRRTCNSPNLYALPEETARHLPYGSIKQIKYLLSCVSSRSTCSCNGAPQCCKWVPSTGESCCFYVFCCALA